ncbi:MAG: TetR/AcrR family transcriptional regulator [Sphingorhabdus sp.]
MPVKIPKDIKLIDSTNGEKSEQARLGILEATISCFAEFGWNGTNMSIIARRTGMTRGKIQYYFPTLDDLLSAAINHLNVEWQKKYFATIDQFSDATARFESGIDVLWAMMEDPLHIAKQELEACARTNPELRVLMAQAATNYEEVSVPAAKQAYPELAQIGDSEIKLARHFTMVFLEGLSIYRFGSDAEAWRGRLIGMLKHCLISYWTSLGAENLINISTDAHRAANVNALDAKRQRALALVEEAAALLAE